MSLFIPQTLASNTWTVYGPDWINWLFSEAVFFCCTLAALKKGCTVERKPSRTDYYGVIVAVFKIHCCFLPFNFALVLPS